MPAFLPSLMDFLLSAQSNPTALMALVALTGFVVCAFALYVVLVAVRGDR